jgi:O-antigen/teichoic acid export membrane protein
MHLATKVAYNAIVQVISKIIATALGLLAVALITRYLGTSGFGEYTTVVSFLSFFGILADLGLTLVTVQMISAPGAQENKILNNLFSLRFFSALIFLGAAPLVITFLPYSGGIKIGAAIAVFSFFFIALNQILVGLFQKNLRMDKVSIAETASRVVLVIGSIIAVRGNFGLNGILLAVVAGSAVNFFLLFLFSFKYASWKFELDISLWREIAKKSWPLALTIFFNLLYLKTDTLILSLVRTQEEVGIYGAAYKVVDILTLIPFMFAGVVLPILTADWLGGNRERFQGVAQKSFDLMIILAVPLVVGTQFLAKPLMVFVAGRDFAAAGPVLQILAYAVGLVFLSSFLSHVIVAAGAQRKIIWAYFLTAVSSVAGYLFFVPRFSYFGAAAITIYSEAAITIFMVFYSFRYASFFPKLKIILKALAAAAAMGASLFFLPPNFCDKAGNLFLALALATIVYFTALYLFGGLTKRDLARLLNREIVEKNL